MVDSCRAVVVWMGRNSRRWQAMRAARDKRPGPARRFLFRLPLLLERMGAPPLGQMVARLLGIDWIILETVGRHTGRPHVVVLDIVGHDRAHDRFYVQPAYGRRADWVRNVTAHPDVTARVGRQRFRARVRDATGPEGAAVVLRFVRAHPWYARLIVYFVGYVDRIDRPDEELRRALATTPVWAVEASPPR